MRRKIIAVCLSAAVLLSALTPGRTADAAAKPKLKTKKISVSVKKSKTIKITKKGKFKISFQSKNKKIAKVSSKGKVTGQKKGRTKVIVYYKKGSQKETGHCFRNSHIQNDPGSSSDRIRSAAGTYTKYDQPASAITDTRRSDT